MGLAGKTPTIRLWFAVLCGYLALGATVQALPAWVRDRFDGGPVAIGSAVGIAFLATASVRPIAGLLGDFGRSRPIVVTGALLTAFGGLGQLLAPHLVWLLLARVVMGAGEASLFSAALPWVLRAHSGGAKVAGWFGLSMWGGLAMGPVVSAIVASVAGVATVWYVVIGLGASAAILVLSTVDKSERKPLPHLGLRDLVPHGAALPGVLIGLGAYGYGTISALLVLYLRVGHLGGDNAALGVFGGAFLVTRAVGAPLADRFPATTLLAGALLLQAAGLTGIALSTGVLGAVFATAVAGIGLALLYPSAVALTLGRADGGRPGASLGAMTSYWDLGIMVAGPAGGAITQVAGFTTAFVVATGVTAVALVVVAAHACQRTRAATTTSD